MHRIDDDSFTQSIVNTHLERTAATAPKPFVNFLSLIVGLSVFIASIGLILLMHYNGEWIYKTGLTVHHGIMIIIISLLFVVYKWLEEVVVSRKFCSV